MSQNTKIGQLVKADKELAREMAAFRHDPYGFVMFAFNWGEADLAGFDGPDDWQKEYLDELGGETAKRNFDGVNAVDPIQMATSSGHGIGKSAIVAWIVIWIMSTRPYASGVVTANTGPQLETKTWAEVAKWLRRSIVKHWFDINTSKGNMKMSHVQFPESWTCIAQTCREENSESFAGNHAVNSTPFYIFDEASNVPPTIWEVSKGGLTDGEPQWHVFGNPTRNSGEFHKCFHGEKHRWITRKIDSRTCRFPNKKLHQQWIEDNGEDSDFVRVRVRGEFPRASDLQFIPTDIVRDAKKREPIVDLKDPLIVGIDVARGGTDNNVVYFRRGYDAKTIPPLKIPGELTRDTTRMAAKIADVMQGVHTHGHIPNAVFLDETGLGGPIGDKLRQLGFEVIGVQFAGEADDKRAWGNKRAEMWGRVRYALGQGLAIIDDDDLETDLITPEFHYDKWDRIVLESKDSMKDRGYASPDIGDGLALTYAYPVASLSTGMHERYGLGNENADIEYDPYGDTEQEYADSGMAIH